MSKLSPRLNVIDRLSRKLGTAITRELDEITRRRHTAAELAAEVEKFNHHLAGQISQALNTAYPSDGLTINGEQVAAGQPDAPHWYIETLGNLHNFAYGRADIYLAFVSKRAGEVVEAAVLSPYADTLLTVSKGGGAYANATRLRTTQVKDVEGALVSLVPAANGLVTKTAENGAQVRISGAAALDLLDVAAGKADGFIGKKLSQADVLLAQLLMRETGGTVTDHGGNTPGEGTTDIIAAGSRLHGRLLKLVATGR